MQAGYLWLVNHIIKHWTVLQERVESESRLQLEREKEVMRQRYEKFRSQSSAPPGTLDDTDADDLPPLPVTATVMAADQDNLTSALPQNGVSKIPLRSPATRSPKKATAAGTTALIDTKTADPGDRRQRSTKQKTATADPKARTGSRKALLSGGNKVAPITR